MGNNSSNLNPPPMKIHVIRGKFLKVSSDGLTATRVEGYADAMFFGSRVAARGEKIQLIVGNMTKDWNGSLRFGFTSHDPVDICNHPEGIPRFMCPDLVKRGGSFIETLNHIKLLKNDRIVFWVTLAGEVQFSVNETLQRSTVTKLVTQPVWPVVDVYGNCSEVKFRSLSDDPDQLEDVKEPRYYSSLNLMEVSVTGNLQSIEVSNKVCLKRKDVRKPFAWNEKALAINTVWVLFVNDVDNANARKLSLAVMNNAPSGSTNSLPDTLDRFPNRLNLFNNIYTRNVVGDEIAICIVNTGDVMVALNGDEFQSIGKVAKSDFYWLVADVNCVVKSLTSLGSFPLTKDNLPQLPTINGSTLPRERSIPDASSRQSSQDNDQVPTTESYLPSIESIEESQPVEAKCLKCSNDKPNAVFIPCGHICYCKSCADTYMSGKNSVKCPKCSLLCNRNIRVFF